MTLVRPIPSFGYGTWNRSGAEARQGVLDALAAGYRHIDTAEGYRNEEFVGAAIAESGVNRDEIFLTTKIAPESYAPGQIMGHVRASLDKLRTDKVDLLLLHWPSIKDEYDIRDYMAQFATVFDAGLTRHIGVSNFTRRYIDSAITLLEGRPITTNQCEIHVLMQNRPIVDYCRAKGIPMTAYSPLARGKVAQSAELAAIGRRHDAQPEQIALAFLLAEGHVVIPSSNKKQRIVSNLAARDIRLDAAEIAAIRKLDAGDRQVNGPWCPAWDV
jgi:2,5-diketo-D-gluconate reductase B